MLTNMQRGCDLHGHSPPQCCCPLQGKCDSNLVGRGKGRLPGCTVCGFPSQWFGKAGYQHVGDSGSHWTLGSGAPPIRKKPLLPGEAEIGLSPPHWEQRKKHQHRHCPAHRRDIPELRQTAVLLAPHPTRSATRDLLSVRALP